ncbi:hypothetical protein BDZ91DRAFT_791951 [Kalaharituber pfeilii]|nr:hypothetical protein BDZ91DRAFT_791951 [Kalaharituber pfeilii]
MAKCSSPIMRMAYARPSPTSDLDPEERDYMEQNWRLKETQVLRSYTRYYANLGAYSTQRNEGHHVVVKQFLNPQITLEQDTLRLAEHLKQATRRLDEEKAESRTKVPRFLDTSIFTHLIGPITITAINLVKIEWEAAKDCNNTEFIDEHTTLHGSWIMPTTLDECGITTGTGATSGSLDPVALQPHDHYEQNGHTMLLRALHDIEFIHSELQGEAGEIFAKRVQDISIALKREITDHSTVPTVPRHFAPVASSSTLPQRKNKGKAAGRTLTGAEMAERQRKRARAESVAHNETQDCITVSSTTSV